MREVSPDVKGWIDQFNHLGLFPLDQTEARLRQISCLKRRVVGHELAYKSKEIYDKANVDEKRILLSQLFTNIVQDEYKIEPKYTKAADFLANWIPKLNYDYELAKIGSNKAKDAVLATSSTNWLRG